MRLFFTASAAWFAQMDAVVQGIHRLPTYPVAYRRSLARVRYEGRFVARDTGSDILYVSVHASTPHLTFAHETGHRVEIRGLAGSPIERQEDFPSWSDTALHEWRQAVLRSDAVLRLQSLYGSVSDETDARIAYYLQPEELWARTYAQFVAMSSRHDTLQAELRDVQYLARRYQILPRQWQDADFTPIMDAIGAMLSKKGWLL